MQSLYNEIVRWLGFKGNEPDSETDALIKELTELSQNTLRPKAIHGTFEIEKLEFNSSDINEHLNGAQKCILFAATLGAESERLSALYQKTDMQKAVVFDAVCDALIESYCDEYCRTLEENYKANGLFINNRFSPGYGDFNISFQQKIAALLNTSKAIGLTENESHILIPKKSVTAVMGIFDFPPKGKARGCESCNMNAFCKMKGTDKCLKQTDSI